MTKNRLKIVRKAKGYTQQQVADYLGISQNNYSYWENGKVKIDNESLVKLSAFFKVSIDFLIGRRYKVLVEPKNWEPSIYEDYINSNEYQKMYLEYCYGNIRYITDEEVFNRNGAGANVELTPAQQLLLELGITSEGDVVCMDNNEYLRVRLKDEYKEFFKIMVQNSEREKL